MMQQTKKKMVLEHLVVHKMNTAADLKQVPLLCNNQHHRIHCLCDSQSKHTFGSFTFLSGHFCLSRAR